MPKRLILLSSICLFTISGSMHGDERNEQVAKLEQAFFEAGAPGIVTIFHKLDTKNGCYFPIATVSDFDLFNLREAQPLHKIVSFKLFMIDGHKKTSYELHSGRYADCQKDPCVDHKNMVAARTLVAIKSVSQVTHEAEVAAEKKSALTRVTVAVAAGVALGGLAAACLARK